MGEGEKGGGGGRGSIAAMPIHYNHELADTIIATSQFQAPVLPARHVALTLFSARARKASSA